MFFEQFGATFCHPQIDNQKMNFDNEDDNYIYKAVMILYWEDSDSKENFALISKEGVTLTGEDSKISDEATRDRHGED
jgi:hypothetical protein